MEGVIIRSWMLFVWCVFLTGGCVLSHEKSPRTVVATPTIFPANLSTKVPMVVLEQLTGKRPSCLSRQSVRCAGIWKKKKIRIWFLMYLRKAIKKKIMVVVVSHLCLLSLPHCVWGQTWIKKTRTERQVREKKASGGRRQGPKGSLKSLREKALLLLNIKAIGHATLLRTLRASLSCKVSVCLESQPDSKRFVPLCWLTLKAPTSPN